MNPNVKLTTEENRVAELAAWGLTQKEIANRLNKSVNTVMNQFRSIYVKTGTNKINELRHGGSAPTSISALISRLLKISHTDFEF